MNDNMCIVQIIATTVEMQKAPTPQRTPLSQYTPTPSPWQPLICFLSLEMCNSGTIYTWNPTVCNHFRLSSFT